MRKKSAQIQAQPTWRDNFLEGEMNEKSEQRVVGKGVN